MEMIKATSNLEFDVIYADGTKHHVKEGILFEAQEDGHTMLHLGTGRPSVIDAFFRAAIEWMDAIRAIKEAQ